MSFSFDFALGDDRDLVRFHLGDTDSNGYYLEDEMIEYWLGETSSVGDTVIACLKYIITQLSTPTFRLDWLSVDPSVALEGYRKILKEKAQEFNVSVTGAVLSSTVANSYRADSYQADADGNYSDYDGAP